MADKKTPSLDELWGKNKKSLTFFGILAAAILYGPGRCFGAVKEAAGWLVEKIEDIIERMLISALEVSAGAKDFLAGLTRAVARKIRKWLWISVAVTVIYWLMLTIGVALENSVIIAITGIMVGLYFVIASWLLENAIYASVLGFDFSKEALAKISVLPKAILEKIGLEIESEKRVRPNRQFLKEQLRDLRFVAVPYAAVAFWLARWPDWGFYGFMFLLIIGAFSLATISSFWKNWPGRLWKIYHGIAMCALIVSIIFYPMERVFPQAMENTGKFLANTVNSWAKSLNEPKIAKVEGGKPAEKPMTPRASTQAPAPAFNPQPMRIASLPVLPVTPPSAEEDGGDNSDVDRLLDAAKRALYEDMDSVGKDTKKVHHVSEPQAKVRVIHIPKWVE